MQLDFNAIRKVLARFVDDDVPAGHQKQPFVALEEEAAGVGQYALVLERAHARRGEQNGFDHGVFRCGLRQATVRSASTGVSP
jgi:hypothetical protein